MSPILQAGFKRFKQNKLGLSCCILFLCIFVLSLAAELIANDKPLLVKYDHALYFPVLKHYPETTFGGVFETETEYKDPVVQQLIQAKGWVVWPLIQYSYQTPNVDFDCPCTVTTPRCKIGSGQMTKVVMFWHECYMAYVSHCCSVLF